MNEVEPAPIEGWGPPAKKAAPPSDEVGIAVPAGAKCAVHPNDGAVFGCVRCGSYGCEACCFSDVNGIATCRDCADLGLGRPVPWEQRKEIGRIRAFWETTKLASRSPTRFFRTPTTVPSVMSAVGHAMLTSTIGLIISYLMAGGLVVLSGGAAALMLPGPQAEPLGAIMAGYGCFIMGLSPLALLAGPANALFGVVYAAAAAHGTLALGGKATAKFEDTLRAVSYANAPYLWQWIPLAGIGSFFWMVGVELIAIRETHGCGSDWAALAVIAHRLVFAVVIATAYIVMTIGSLALLTNLPAPG
ncbi:MAG: hypothetical protein AB8I08_23525 [Sandaracinaceae bacterium]